LKRYKRHPSFSFPLYLHLYCFALQDSGGSRSDSEGSDSDSERPSEDNGSKEASTLAGTKHKSDNVLAGAAKRSSSGGSPGANSAPLPVPNLIGAALGAKSAPTPGPVPITLTPEQLRALQAIANRQCQTNVSGEYI